MPQIMQRMIYASLLLLTAFIISACSDSNSKSIHNTDEGHPANWVTGHGDYFASEPNRCTECHGTDLLGGLSKVSCNSPSLNGVTCHPSDPPHLATLLSSDGSVHPDNSNLFCGKCHDLNNFQNDVKYQCRRCHTDAGDTSDPLNGNLKTRYPDPFPYGFGSAANVVSHSAGALGTHYGNWDIECVTCHNPHSQEQDRAYNTSYGKLLRASISYENQVTGETVAGTARFIGPGVEDELVDESSDSEKFCEVCHTQTSHHRKTDTAPGDLDINSEFVGHDAGNDCTLCHSHTTGFKPAPDSGHPPGWVSSHGQNYLINPDGCTACHGEDFLGGVAKVSCNSSSLSSISCHSNDPPHLAPLLSLDGSVHPDNASLFCGKCHDLNNFYSGARYQCQRCHADPGDTSDPLNGTLKSLYSDSFPYGFGSAANAVSHSSNAVGTHYGNWDIECVTCHNPHSQEQDRAYNTSYGKLLRASISYENQVTGETVSDTVGREDFCEVCHTQTSHHRNDDTAPGDLDINSEFIGHDAGDDCTVCHSHTAGFEPASDAGHPPGWISSHGQNYLINPDGCTACHGEDLMGGVAEVSCNSSSLNGVSCHSNDPPHLTPLLSPDGSVHTDNASLFCGKCHDLNNFYSDARYQCQRCHSDPGDTSDPLNGTLKSLYSDVFPYGFGSALNVVSHSSLTVGNKYGNWDIKCVTCHNPHSQEQDRENSSSYGKLIRTSISYENQATGDILSGPVEFTSDTGQGSFADGAPYEENICEICHTRTIRHRNDGGAPADLDSNNDYIGHNDGTDCVTCHSHSVGFKAECTDCHEVPPPTGTHLVHFGGNVDQAEYGSTGIAQDVTGQGNVYLMNCGNCHPMDPARHLNGVPNSGGGTAEIELWDASAPPGSLKALNPPSATYTPGEILLTDAKGMNYTQGSCENIYCHSYLETTTTAEIPIPTLVSINPYTLVYDPPWETLVVQTRRYLSPEWGGGLPGCNGCHGYPIVTEYPAVSAGAGDSHGWRNDFGEVDLHVWNMGFGPLQCRTCHYDTVRDEAPWTQDNMGNTTFDDIPIFNTSKHINGNRDILFTPDPVLLKTEHDLTSAAYDPQTKTCTNVSCHLKQTEVVWGSPYRYWVNECQVCHQK